MSEEPTVGEQLRRLGDQLSRVESEVSKLVSSEKHEYTTREMVARSELLAERIDRIETSAEKARDDQVQTRRLIWTVFLIPLGLMLLQIYLSSWSK